MLNWGFWYEMCGLRHHIHEISQEISQGNWIISWILYIYFIGFSLGFLIILAYLLKEICLDYIRYK